MEVGALIARYIEALVWPTAIIIIILIFKNQIEQVILRLSRLRYKGVELEFGRDLQEVESKAKALELPPPQVIKGADEPITIASSYDRLIELASVAPRTAVTEAWLIVEAALQHASLSLPVRPRGYGLVREAFEELIKRNLLPQETNAVFDDLRKIRNNAAHAMEFDISSEEAIRYIDLATGLAAWIKSKMQ